MSTTTSTEKELEKLLDRVQELDGVDPWPDRDLDRDLWFALCPDEAAKHRSVRWRDFWFWRWRDLWFALSANEATRHRSVPWDCVPAYTSSFDAVLVLLKKRLPKADWQLQHGGEYHYGATVAGGPTHWAYNPPVAMLKATLGVLIALAQRVGQPPPQRNPEPVLPEPQTEAERLNESAEKLASSLRAYEAAVLEKLKKRLDELIDAQAKVEAAQKLVRESRLAHALGHEIPEHIQYWKGVVGFDAQAIVAENHEKDGLKGVTVDFTFSATLPCRVQGQWGHE
jgi:hypothetical protein